MAIFNSYVSLPEGKSHDIPWYIRQTISFPQVRRFVEHAQQEHEVAVEQHVTWWTGWTVSAGTGHAGIINNHN